MKKILTSNIETPVRQPFTRYSLEHLQNSYTELGVQLSNSPLFTQPEYFDYNYPQIIWGCYPVSLIGQIYNIPKGLVKYNDELYYVKPTVFLSVIGPNVPVVYIETTYITQDPLELTDGSLVNVHQNQEMIVMSGVAGSGGSTQSNLTYVCDFSDLLQTPTITELYPTLALTDGAYTPVSSTSAFTGWTVITNNNDKDQFGEVVIDSLFESSTPIARSRGWHQFGTINGSISPIQPYYTTSSYRLVYDHIDNITYDFYAVGIRIEDNKIYYWDSANDAGNTYYTNIDLKLRFVV